MGEILRGHSILWILFIWFHCLSPISVCIGLLDIYEKECQGTTWGLSHSGSIHSKRYEDYRKRYENCTFIRDNIEIVHMQVPDKKYDFSFLDTIREVNGYVLIYGNFVNRIRLNGLRVIRGWKTYSTIVDGTERHFSLCVRFNADAESDSIGLKELQLTSLVEITNGDVLFEGNSQLCFGETTIDWKSITQKHNPNAKFIINSLAKKTECNGTCHENCTIGDDRLCWAETPDTCQAERPCGNCRRNCSGIDCSCHSECIGGCTGSNESSSCVACKNFLRADECVGNCSALKYNPDTSKWKKPPTTYMLGMRCVPKCPENMLIQGDACVTACATGYKKNNKKNAKKCFPCNKACPKTCNGTGETWLHGNNLAQFNRCKIVDGPLKIVNGSFVGHKVGPKIEFADLEILKDVQEITGQLSIEVWHSNLSSLSFLKNLRIIGGFGELPYSLIIRSTLLTALNLKSLTQIKTGGVYMTKNAALCYAHTINWTRILTSTKTDQKVIVKENANPAACEKQGLTCSKNCSDLGCWGPGRCNCVSGHDSTKKRCLSMEYGY